MEESATIRFLSEFRNEWRQVLSFFIDFAKSPLACIRRYPNWHWQTMIIVSGLIGAISGVVSGLVSMSILTVILGVIFVPITYTVFTLIVSGFFYYVFLFFFNKQIEYKHIYFIVMMAGLPVMLVNIISSFLPPIQLIGLAGTAILLVVGFTDSFQLPRRKLIKFVGFLFAVYAVFWVISSIQWAENQSGRKVMTAPASLDILEKELGKSSK